MNLAVLLSAIALSSALLVLQSRSAPAPASLAPALQDPGSQPAAPLTPDQLQIYRAFLASYAGPSLGPATQLHLANLTAPFEPTEDDATGCLKDFPAHPVATGTHSLSALKSDSNIQLVDPDQFQIATPGAHDELNVAADKALSNGLLTLSEIVFTADHQFAALNYNLACGGFCRRGGTAVFERSPSGWMRVNRFCSSWHS